MGSFGPVVRQLAREQCLWPLQGGSLGRLHQFSAWSAPLKDSESLRFEAVACVRAEQPPTTVQVVAVNRVITACRSRSAPRAFACEPCRPVWTLPGAERGPQP